LIAVKKILRYLYSTKDAKLFMNSKCSDSSEGIKIVAYCDADWCGDLEERKSTSGFIIKINGCPVIWKSQKQKSVSLSTAEAEISAAGAAVKEIQWLQNFLTELGVQTENSNSQSAAVLYCDNKAAVLIAKQDMANSRTRHVAMYYHYIKQAVEEGKLEFRWIQSTEQQADILTKPLGVQPYRKLRNMLMGEC
jgi:hypothetical protein